MRKIAAPSNQQCSANTFSTVAKENELFQQRRWTFDNTGKLTLLPPTPPENCRKIDEYTRPVTFCTGIT